MKNCKANSLFLSLLITTITYGQCDILNQSDRSGELKVMLNLLNVDNHKLLNKVVGIHSLFGTISICSHIQGASISAICYTNEDAPSSFEPQIHVTNLAYKATENMIYDIIVYPEIDKELEPGDYVDVGFCKYTYGEQTGFIFERLKRQRYYSQDNIFTETITLSNGFILYLTNKIWLDRVLTVNKNMLHLGDYNFPHK